MNPAGQDLQPEPPREASLPSFTFLRPLPQISSANFRRKGARRTEVAMVVRRPSLATAACQGETSALVSPGATEESRWPDLNWQHPDFVLLPQRDANRFRPFLAKQAVTGKGLLSKAEKAPIPTVRCSARLSYSGYIRRWRKHFFKRTVFVEGPASSACGFFIPVMLFSEWFGLCGTPAH